MAGQRRTAQDRQRCTGGIRLCRDANANAVAALLSATADADQTQTRRRLGARPCPVQVVLVLSRRLPAHGFICVYQSSACRACCHLLLLHHSNVHRLPSLLTPNSTAPLQRASQARNCSRYAHAGISHSPRRSCAQPPQVQAQARSSAQPSRRGACPSSRPHNLHQPSSITC